LFSSNQYDLGHFSSVRHSIFVSHNVPISTPSRKIPYALESKVDKMINEMLQNNIIRKSTSPWNAPLVVVPKKNGDIRICLDYRKLNSFTEKPIFHIPPATEIFDRLGGCSVFTTLDLSKGYYQIMMDESDAEKTAFSTSKGHFEFVRMPFGLSGAPATFQRALTLVLANELNKRCCVYLDDIIIFGKDKEEHDNNLRVVLKQLNSAGLKLSLEKCIFRAKQVSYLGHIIDKDGVRTDPQKIEKVKNWPLPQKMSELQSFLGFAGYYRRFLKNFSTFSTCLEKLIQRHNGKAPTKQLQWTENSISAFNNLKDALCSSPVLSLPSHTATYILDTDASNSCTGAVLSQQVNGDEKVVCYASNALTKTEKNYCTTRRELLAVIKYLRFFRHYSLGRRFILRTDHKSLVWLMNWKNPSTSQYWSWIEELMEFDFEIQYRPGDQHANADGLSRLPSCQQCGIKHEEPKKKRQNKHIRQILELKEIEKLRLFLEKKIPIEKMNSSPYCPFLPFISLQGDNIIFNKAGSNCLVVSSLEGLEKAKLFHQNLAHCGFNRLFNTLRNLFMWPGMKDDIFNVVSSCEFCLQRKTPGPAKHFKKGLNSEYPFQKVFTDICGPLPTTKGGYRYILAIIDGYSKWCSLIPLKTITADEVASKILKNWICIYGPPEKLHSDRGLNFCSQVLKKMCDSFGIKKTETSPYYPKGNGIVERLFKSIKDFLYCCSKQRGLDWSEVLWNVELATRTSFNKTIGMTPYEIIFQKPPSYFFSTTPNRTEGNLEFKLVELARKALRKNIDIKLSSSAYSIGDYVYARILPEKLKSVYNARYDGPFAIIAISGAYLVQLYPCKTFIMVKLSPEMSIT